MKKYTVSYLPSFQKELNERITYIAEKEQDIDRALEVTEAVEQEIENRSYCAESFEPIAVIDVKYKPVGRPDRSDSHQLLAYVLLTGVDRCAFILPGDRTQVRGTDQKAGETDQ